jgi:ferredoxin
MRKSKTVHYEEGKTLLHGLKCNGIDWIYQCIAYSSIHNERYDHNVMIR